MNPIVSVFGSILLLGVLAFIILGIVTSSQKSKATATATDTHNKNLGYLQSIGFRIENQYVKNELDIYLYFDYTNKLGALEYYNKIKCEAITVFPINKVISCELIQDGTVVHKNAVAPAMIGAYFMGLGGALAGATAMSNDAHVGVLAVRLLLDDMKIPSLMISVLKASTDKSTPEYQNAFYIVQEIYGIFEGIVRINDAERQRNAQSAKESNTQSGDSHDEIIDQLGKLADLKTKGVLTEQEFEEKKAVLLSKMK